MAIFTSSGVSKSVSLGSRPRDNLSWNLVARSSLFNSSSSVRILMSVLLVALVSSGVASPNLNKPSSANALCSGFSLRVGMP